MKRSKNIAVRNIAGKPLRSAVLVILAALLSLTVCAGTLIVRSLRSGLDSLEARLGADVMVVPKEASQKQSFENIVLQGSTGYFYMDKSLMDKVTGRDGVGKSSPQFFLASASAGCCSIPVQIIGFDPDTDFTITPWIKRSYGGELGLFDVVIGNDLNAFVGDSIKFYGVDCRVRQQSEHLAHHAELYKASLNGKPQATAYQSYNEYITPNGIVYGGNQFVEVHIRSV